MKAVCITGMPNSFYSRAAIVINAVNGALSELGLPVSQVNLLGCCLPYYEEGAVVESFTKLAAALKDTKNIILAYNATDGSPSAIMKVFLEYLGGKKNSGLFDGKNIMNISISDGYGESEAAEYVARLMGRLGAHELTRICAGGETLNDIISGKLPVDAVEKYAEDYYRLIRQKRVFLRTSAYKSGLSGALREKSPGEELNTLKAQVETSMKKSKQDSTGAKAMDIISENKTDSFGNDFFMDFVTGIEETKPAGISAFGSGHDEHIEELARLFATKLKGDEPPARGTESVRSAILQPSADDIAPVKRKAPGKNAPEQHTVPIEQLFPDTAPTAYKEHTPHISPVIPAASVPVVPRGKTCRQMTGSLPHYFQTQLAQDTEAVFQFNIFGEEEFSGYIVIKNRDNEYYDGQYDSPDITIMSSASVWQNVLRGKLTAQKAFMTGQLKVRGNFMLLNRFDQLYKKMS